MLWEASREWLRPGSIYIGAGGVGPGPCSATNSVWGDLGQSLLLPGLSFLACETGIITPLLLPSRGGWKDRGMTQRV